MGRKNGCAGWRDAGGGGLLLEEPKDGSSRHPASRVLLEERKDGTSRHRALQSGQALLLLLLARKQRK